MIVLLRREIENKTIKYLFETDKPIYRIYILICNIYTLFNLRMLNILQNFKNVLLLKKIKVIYVGLEE